MNRQAIDCPSPISTLTFRSFKARFDDPTSSSIDFVKSGICPGVLGVETITTPGAILESRSVENIYRINTATATGADTDRINMLFFDNGGFPGVFAGQTGTDNVITQYICPETNSFVYKMSAQPLPEGGFSNLAIHCLNKTTGRKTTVGYDPGNCPVCQICKVCPDCTACPNCQPGTIPCPACTAASCPTCPAATCGSPWGWHVLAAFIGAVITAVVYAIIYYIRRR